MKGVACETWWYDILNYHHCMTLQIAVEGNIASGKSTLLSKLSQLESVEVRDANTFFVTCKHSLVPKLLLLVV